MPCLFCVTSWARQSQAIFLDPFQAILGNFGSFRQFWGSETQEKSFKLTKKKAEDCTPKNCLCNLSSSLANYKPTPNTTGQRFYHTMEVILLHPGNLKAPLLPDLFSQGASQNPVLPFLGFLGKRQGNPQKKTRIVCPYRTPKIPEKEGKMLQITRNASQGQKGTQTKKPKEGQGNDNIISDNKNRKVYCHGISLEKKKQGFCAILPQFPPSLTPSKTQFLLIVSFRRLGCY